MDISSGVKRASDEEELVPLRSAQDLVNEHFDTPHTNKILHHELVDSFCRMRHIHLALAISEIGLKHLSVGSTT